MRGIQVHNQGMLTTVQDGGRYGYRRFGMPVSGAMDRFSFRCANLLVGNDQESPALEVTLMGPEIEFLGDMNIAITGADFEAFVDKRKVPGWETIRIRRGSRLKFTSIIGGARLYIAFAGGLQSDIVMGSASTYLYGKTGGFRGREVRKGDIITICKSRSLFHPRLRAASHLLPLYSNEITVRILPGVNFDSFDAGEKKIILESEYSLSQNCDRMGLRLEGGLPLPAKLKADVVSYGIHFGAIQLPGDGNPIIMGPDAQTTGGYLQFANVAGADLDLLAQAKPGDRLKFMLIGHNEAIELLKKKEALIEKIFGKRATAIR